MNEREPEPRMEPQTPMLPKPLRVQVAEALGHRIRYHEWWDEDDRQNVRMPCWCETGFPAPGPVHHRHWEEWEPSYGDDGDWDACRFYDTSWSATGPLIERLRIGIYYNDPWDDASLWTAEPYGIDLKGPHGATGQTPLEAVCRLIVALAAATPTGKLELGQHGAQS